MNLLSPRDTILNNEILRAELGTIVTNPHFKLLCTCILADISRAHGGAFMPGAHAFVDALMQYPFPPPEPAKVEGLDYRDLTGFPEIKKK